MSDFLVAIGLVLVIEGVLYALAPSFAKRMAAVALETPEQSLRAYGLVAAILGVGIVWLCRSFFGG